MAGATDPQLRRALARAEDGKTLAPAEIVALLQARGERSSTGC